MMSHEAATTMAAWRATWHATCKRFPDACDDIDHASDGLAGDYILYYGLAGGTCSDTHFPASLIIIISCPARGAPGGQVRRYALVRSAYAVARTAADMRSAAAAALGRARFVIRE